jgi:DNA repair exonuclease SbcCD ATPase subunit
MPVIVPSKPVTIYKTESEAIQHQHRLANLQEQLVSKMNEVDQYADQLQEIPEIDLGPEPQTIFSSEAEAIKNQNRMSTLGEQILNKDKEVDPYADQIQEMNSTVLQSIDYEKVNNLNKLIDHQKFLQELLTNKDSFVRKHIIDQNLSYLNNRMSEYLNAIGLPHQVVFQNDLSVEISEFGRELDYDNLSRGESNRVILALSFAFRDVYENLFHSINSLFIDELIDSGMDTVGVENSLGILKDMSYHQRRGIWLVSHKEELINRVPNVLRVVKSGGFTSYSS